MWSDTSLHWHSDSRRHGGFCRRDFFRVAHFYYFVAQVLEVYNCLKGRSMGNLSVDAVPPSGDAFRAVDESQPISLLNNSAIPCFRQFLFMVSEIVFCMFSIYSV